MSSFLSTKVCLLSSFFFHSKPPLKHPEQITPLAPTQAAQAASSKGLIKASASAEKHCTGQPIRRFTHKNFVRRTQGGDDDGVDRVEDGECCEGVDESGSVAAKVNRMI